MKPSRSEVVLLAAGRSSRLGEPKGLVDVQGRPWLDHQLEALDGRRVIVVLGHDRERYFEALPALSQRVVVAVNPDPERGPFSSLQVGLACVTSGASAFVLPIDVPAASPAVWSALEQALAVPALDAAVPTHGTDGTDRGGHPVLLAPAFVASLRARPVDDRLDRVLGASRAAGRVARVGVDDPRVRLNLNERQDWVLIGVGQ